VASGEWVGQRWSKSVPHSVSYDAILIFLSVLPKGGPVITGGKQRYSLADFINILRAHFSYESALSSFFSTHR